MSESQTNQSAKTMQDLLKENYPSEFYGIVSSDSQTLSFGLDVWNNSASDNRIYDLTDLPAASALISMTAAQFSNLLGATRVGVDPKTMTIEYPDRYYARYDDSAAQPTGVLGWIDAWDISSTAAFPPASDMVALTPAQWEARMTGPQGVKSGSLIDYTPIPAPIPLETQANNELQWISGQASMAAAMGETFTGEMKTYVKAVQAIASGTDATSAALPQRPGNIMA